MTSRERQAQDHHHSDRLRREAAPYTLVGGLAAASWMLLETGRLLESLHSQASAITQEGKAGWSKLGFAAATVAIGALMVSAHKHSHASRIGPHDRSR